MSELTHRVFHGALTTHIRIYMTCESTYLKHVLRIYFYITHPYTPFNGNVTPAEEVYVAQEMRRGKTDGCRMA